MLFRSFLGDDRVKVTEDICRQGINPAGGQEDLAFLNSEILSYYYSSPGWLAGPLPNGQKYHLSAYHTTSHSICTGWEKEGDTIIGKCHKNRYKYFDAKSRKRVGHCVKGMASRFMVSVTVMD